MKYIQNDKGLSLIELLAAILLISVIIVSFFSLLVQSNKTTTASNSIMDTTYYAQTELEKIYAFQKDARPLDKILKESRSYTFESKKAFNGPAITRTDLTNNSDKPIEREQRAELVYTKEDSQFTYTLTVRPLEIGDETAPYYTLIITVKNKSTNSTSTMETIYQIGGRS